MTPAEFSAAVGKLRAVPNGRVEVQDWFTVDRPPYRLAHFRMECDAESFEVRLLQMGRLALELAPDANLTVWTHYSPVEFNISLSRDLTDDEIDDDPPAASREVAP